MPSDSLSGAKSDARLQRVLIMGGQLTLDSELGEGTTLSVTVPLDA
ncbi:hypothetical protein [Pseudomonas sp. FP833]|nr:hypothetical protein [Pseudomonas sp. FP833]WLI50599.1 hypothetical protein PSH63_30130 [Pseudomonas sp. FP833]